MYNLKKKNGKPRANKIHYLKILLYNSINSLIWWCDCCCGRVGIGCCCGCNCADCDCNWFWVRCKNEFNKLDGIPLLSCGPAIRTEFKVDNRNADWLEFWPFGGTIICMGVYWFCVGCGNWFIFGGNCCCGNKFGDGCRLEMFTENGAGTRTWMIEWMKQNHWKFIKSKWFQMDNNNNPVFS